MKTRNHSILVLLGVLAAALLAAHPAIAQDVWSSTPVSANWNNASNWSALPVSGDAIAFSNSSQTTLNNDLTTAGFAVNNLAFWGSASAYTISGNDFTLGTGDNAGTLWNVSMNIQTINNNITLGNFLRMNQ